MKINCKFLFLSLVLIFSFKISYSQDIKEKKYNKHPFEKTSKPYTRYWWFASSIKEKDIRYNLNYLKNNGFGGVEIAWVYPLNRFNKNDTTYTPRQEWLSPEWTKIVEYAVNYADSIGLGCDLTFGTLWPFGDTYVPFSEAVQRYGDSKWRQEISRSWQHPKVGYVVDHLTPKYYQKYFDRLMNAFPKVKTKVMQSYFIDSWEVETDKLWCDGFEIDFQNEYGYDISKFMDSIYNPKNCMQLYDYMSLISDKVLKFYRDYDEFMNINGVLSRGQVSGAPCDLISGYALLDIPEGESMLFEPEFCTIPASAALLSSKNYVSSETFTCIYGWPRDYIRQEQTADLKLVADALFANGINQIIWHGKAHNPDNCDTVNFYATTHNGASGNIAPELPMFNAYLEKISTYMKKGNTYSDFAVYLPTEDAWLKGIMPKEKQFIWAWGYYEMRYVYFPKELDSYNPTWINAEFLEKAEIKEGKMYVGNAEFKGLYIDVNYMDYRALKKVADFASQGLPIVLKKIPQEPGINKHLEYMELIKKIKKCKNVYNEIPIEITKFFNSKYTPKHWIRKDNEDYYVFFPNPKSNNLKFPMEYGQSLNTETVEENIDIKLDSYQYKLKLIYKPYQSLLYKFSKGKAEQIDITFIPKTPIVKKRSDNYVAPWLVK